ncbi:MAG: hypothetical protein D6758_13985 [Gammaproteobacteria bacterium]|nr:MAG: hypothetical protein D6758_13985 [Gammaproteobacteria bacterium]
MTQLAEGVQKVQSAVAQVKSGIYLIRDIRPSAPTTAATHLPAQSPSSTLILQGTLEQWVLQLPGRHGSADWLKAGQWVSVLTGRQGLVQLQPAHLAPDSERAVQIRAALAHASLRRWLPLEQPLSQSLQQLQRVPADALRAAGSSVSGVTQGSSGIPSAGLEGVRQYLISHLPRADDLARPEGLKQALEFAGLWSEQRLIGSPSTAADLKLLVMETLVRASRSLQLPPNQLEMLFRHDFPQGADSLLAQITQALSASKKTSANRQPALDIGQWLHVLARLLTRVHVQQLNQLASQSNTPDPATPQTLWVAELPWQHKGQADVLELQVARRDVEKGPRGTPATQWQVTLAFPWGDSGTLHARILYCDAQVSAHFWAPDDILCQQVDRQSSLLEAGLTRWGLSVGEISAQVGEPPREQRGISRHYIDTRV